MCLPSRYYAKCVHVRTISSGPKECHLKVVKRIVRYLIHTPNFGIWYNKRSSFDVVGYSDSDYAGDKVDRKSTLGTFQLLVDLLCLGLPRNKTRYPYPPPKRNTLPLDHVVLNYFEWPKLLKIMGYMWNMFHCFVIMRVLLRLLIIPCNIIKLSIFKFVIISFEIMFLREISILNMFIPISNWRIYSPNRLMRKYFADWEVNWTSLMLQTWSRNSIWIHASHEPMTNPWLFSYDDDHMSWIYLHPCMLSNPCRVLGGI